MPTFVFEVGADNAEVLVNLVGSYELAAGVTENPNDARHFHVSQMLWIACDTKRTIGQATKVNPKPITAHKRKSVMRITPLDGF